MSGRLRQTGLNISIVDIAGKELLHYVSNIDDLTTKLNVTSLNEGIYMIIVRLNNEELFIDKVVIVR